MLNSALYEWDHHVPILREEGGLSEEVVEEVKKRKAWQGWEDIGEGAADNALLNEKQRAILAYTDAMTISVKVSGEVFAGIQKHFTEKEIVEITTTVAAYNCVSRFLVALDVGEMNEKEATR